jgi:hypothetical protein
MVQNLILKELEWVKETIAVQPSAPKYTIPSEGNFTDFANNFLASFGRA